nr:hypothetical protein [uncultured Pseudomonas sp.]
MTYGAVVLASYALSYYLVGLLLDGQLADIAEGLRHRPDAPPPAQYLRAVQSRLRRVRRHYSLVAGTLLAAFISVGIYWLG